MPQPQQHEIQAICDLHHSLRQRWIFNPLSEARDQTHNLIVPTQICFCSATTGTSADRFLTCCATMGTPPNRNANSHLGIQKWVQLTITEGALTKHCCPRHPDITALQQPPPLHGLLPLPRAQQLGTTCRSHLLPPPPWQHRWTMNQHTPI